MPGFTHFAWPVRVRKNQLVDDDVVRVNATLGQFLDQSLRLIQGEELGDTHTDEGGLFLKKASRGIRAGSTVKIHKLFSQVNRTEY